MRCLSQTSGGVILLPPAPLAPTLQSITKPCPVLHPKCQRSCAPVSTVASSSKSGSLWPSLPPNWSRCLHPPLPQAHSPPAARVISKKHTSYHLAHMLRITQGLPVALRVRVRIPNEAVGSGPSLPVRPLLPVGSHAPSGLLKFPSSGPLHMLCLLPGILFPHGFQLANVNQVSA